MVSAMLVICMLAGCNGTSGKGGEESGSAPAGEASQVVTVNTGMGKVTVKEASKDVTYVAESAEAPQGNLASVTPDGKLWGWDLDGTLWNDPDFPKDIDLSNARQILMIDDQIIIGNMQSQEQPQVTMLTFYDRQGKILGNLDLGGRVAEGIGGGPYLFLGSGDYGARKSIVKLDADKKELGWELADFPEEVRGIFLQGSSDEEVYLYTTDAVYRYAVSEKVFYKLFDWTDVGLIGSQIAFVWKGSGDDVYAVTFAGMGGRESYRLTPKMTAELPKKEELTIAILSSNSDGKLQKFVSEFNKSQSEIHAVIKTYASNPGGDEDAIKARMQADFLGSDPPDMICLANLNSNEALVKQGYLLDLRSFLAESEVLSEEDFYPEVLDTYTQGGILYSIPYTFSMQSLVIPAKVAGSAPGWTFPEMIEYLRSKQEYRPFRMFWFMQYYVFNDDLGYFFDEQTGTHSFDSEEFRELLEYMKECKDKEESMPSERPFVFAQEDFRGLASFADFEEEYGEEVRIMGYPTRDRTPLTVIEGTTELSILATAKHPDWAWKFMEFYLSRDPKEGERIYNTYNIYSNKNWMQAMIEEELPLYGKDHVDVLDEEGNVVGAHYSAHKINQACVDAFLETLSHVRSRPAGTREIRIILYEEAAPYFEGQKTLDQVIDVITNRVSLYLAEQR